MKKLQILVALVALLALAGFAGRAASAAGETSTIQLLEQNNSGQSGTATFTYAEDYSSVTIEINLSNGTAEPQPAHIHAGTCADLDPKPFYPLSSVVNGKSVTTITEEEAGKLDYEQFNQFAINVHKSAAEASVYVACGDIVPGGTQGESGGAVAGMPRTGDSGNGVLPVLAALALVGVGIVMRFARRRV